MKTIILPEKYLPFTRLQRVSLRIDIPFGVPRIENNGQLWIRIVGVLKNHALLNLN